MAKNTIRETKFRTASRSFFVPMQLPRCIVFCAKLWFYLHLWGTKRVALVLLIRGVVKLLPNFPFL